MVCGLCVRLFVLCVVILGVVVVAVLIVGVWSVVCNYWLSFVGFVGVGLLDVWFWVLDLWLVWGKCGVCCTGSTIGV